MRGNVPADIIFYRIGEGIVLREKTLIAFDTSVPKILAIGNEAEKIDTSPEGVECFSPFHFGVIEDFTCAEKMMKYFVKKAFGSSFGRPSLALCFQEPVEGVALKAYEEVMYCAGAKKVQLYPGSSDSFLQNTPKEELKQYKGVVEITKERPIEYARELVRETCERVRGWGVSREQLVEMLKEIEE